MRRARNKNSSWERRGQCVHPEHGAYRALELLLTANPRLLRLCSASLAAPIFNSCPMNCLQAFRPPRDRVSARFESVRFGRTYPQSGSCSGAGALVEDG